MVTNLRSNAKVNDGCVLERFESTATDVRETTWYNPPRTGLELVLLGVEARHVEPWKLSPHALKDSAGLQWHFFIMSMRDHTWHSSRVIIHQMKRSSPTPAPCVYAFVLHWLLPSNPDSTEESASLPSLPFLSFPSLPQIFLGTFPIFFPTPPPAFCPAIPVALFFGVPVAPFLTGTVMSLVPGFAGATRFSGTLAPPPDVILIGTPLDVMYVLP